MKTAFTTRALLPLIVAATFAARASAQAHEHPSALPSATPAVAVPSADAKRSPS